MRAKIFLVGLILITLLTLSLLSLKNLAIGGNDQNTQISDPLVQVQNKLDQILANQEKLFARLDAMEQELTHQIKIFGTP